MKKFLLILITVGLFSGCTTVRMYPGDPLPKEKISILKGAWNEYFFLWRINGRIYKVDGEKLESPDIVELIPGKHEISAYLTQTFSTGLTLSGKIKTFRINTKAGHTYIIDGKWNGGDNEIWIKDDDTGEIITN